MLDYSNKLEVIDNIYDIKNKVPYILAVDANVPNAKPSIVDLVSTYVNYALDQSPVTHEESLVNINSFLDECDTFQSTNNGYQGYQGYRGYSGVQGPQGPQGFKGADPPPDAGAQGYTGYQGIQGYKGYQGKKGIQGPQGLIGPKPSDSQSLNLILSILSEHGLVIGTDKVVKCKSVDCSERAFAATGFYQK